MRPGIGSLIVMVLIICAVMPTAVTTQAATQPTTAADQSLEWTTHDVYGSMAWGKTSLVLDSQGNEHIAFWDTTLNDLIYATNVGGSWASSVVDHSWNTTGEAVIAVDGSGKPHLVYTVVGDPGTTTAILRYAVLLEGSWNVTDVAIGNISWGLDVALDSERQRPHRLPRVPLLWDLADLVYCTNEDGSWVKTVVGDAGRSHGLDRRRPPTARRTSATWRHRTTS